MKRRRILTAAAVAALLLLGHAEALHWGQAGAERLSFGLGYSVFALVVSYLLLGWARRSRRYVTIAAPFVMALVWLSPEESGSGDPRAGIQLRESPRGTHRLARASRARTRVRVMADVSDRPVEPATR